MQHHHRLSRDGTLTIRRTRGVFKEGVQYLDDSPDVLSVSCAFGDDALGTLEARYPRRQSRASLHSCVIPSNV